jgi:hypothetical protein
LSNCAIEKVWYGNIQKAAFKMLFRDEVEFLEENVTIPNEIRPIENTSTQV